MSAEQIQDIEVRIAFLEKSILDLDDVVRTLGDQLQLLRTELTMLREAVSDRSLIVRGTPQDERPPHY